MKILLLGPKNEHLIRFFEIKGDTVACFEDRIELIESDFLNKTDYVICYGYRHILRKDFLDLFPQRVINLHISMLPWNRGADPNLWSFLECTPHGVSIHLVDEGLDTGDIIAQRTVEMDVDVDTLRTSYEKLSCAIEALFVQTWPVIKDGKLIAKQQLQGGSFHRSKDKDAYMHLLVKGWDTPIAALIGKAKSDKRS